MKYIILFTLFHSLIINPAESNCPEPFDCGNLGTIEFPLSDRYGCGLFMVRDCSADYPSIQFEAGGPWYSVMQNISTNKILVLDYSLHSNFCFAVRNVSLPVSPSVSLTVSPNLTMFTCRNGSHSEQVDEYFQHYNHTSCPQFSVYYKGPAIGVPDTGIPSDCSMIQLPASSNPRSSNLSDLISPVYVIEWDVSEDCNECHNGGGKCLTGNMNRFHCDKGNQRFKKILPIGGVTLAAFTVTFIIAFLFYALIKKLGLGKARTRQEQEIELFLNDHGNLAQKRYKYSDLKKITKSFKEKLGEGGYGNVYKGKLPDDRLVAVKLLNESKGDGEEFMNEVASISRTSHINVVTLLGFCFEGSKRALVYELMPNGSLEKYVQNNGECGLGWEKLFGIALGIARGLDYLHQGCNTRILHFDIKPHNILLDKDFNPKISDFGLAKVCPNRSSIVSMLVARGTIGYIAPEVFCMNFGEVSYKSDVYSYGMMVLEIAGQKRKIDRREVDRTSEMYFPQYIYNQLEAVVERCACVDGIVIGDESELAKRKLIIVGLWCIQTDPKDRPTMSKVVEMLEGKVEALQVPPKPYLSSPPRLALNFSTVSQV